MRTLFGVFPLLLIPVAMYNMIAFSNSDFIEFHNLINSDIFRVNLISGTEWGFSMSDGFVLLSIFLLFAEIIKATSTGVASIANHVVSMIVFIGCLIQFLLISNFGTSTFFLITAIALIDVLAGIVVTIVSARRDFSVGQALAG